MWGYALGQAPGDEAQALPAIVAAAWRLVQALRGSTAAAQRRWYVAQTQQPAPAQGEDGR